MMTEQDLADVVQIAVEDLNPDHPVVLENHEVTDEDVEPALKRQRIEINCQDPSIKSFLYSINQTICLRLDSIEAKLLALEATCKSLEEKLDLVMNKQHSPIQVPMVAGSPLGATQTCNKVRCVVPQTTVILNNDRQNSIVAKMVGQEEPLSRTADSLENILSNAVPGRRQNTIVVKVPGHDDSHNEDGESGSEASDSVSNSGQIGSQSIGNNVTLITLNSEGHLFYKFGISESDWYRIKQSIDSKCRTAWRRKQRGQSLAVKSFSRRTPSSSSYSGSEGTQSTVSASNEIQQNQPQALHYALANAQQVQIHQIGEDGQVQVIPQGHLHIAQVPQGEQVQITQDSEGNLQIHQVHVGQDGQVLQGAQLIAVASADPASGGVDGSPLQGSDIQVQYVQLAPVTDHTATTQSTDTLPSAIQPEMQIEHGAIQIQ
ncbi:PREDICTED: protein BANP isoform X3 [Crocodylus porosus]|uniref:protein BANP isoform X4 n=1 Tax=Gavialis gangeticus TaxID=94835 RepID=UPI00092E2AA1|nr:PREDICTED: protein BANP isoform X4 [Gavialis gangeticus]XP_019391554.1 PREDICTED: protein BANP isoform X3 [Crocodylus porosus]